MTSRRQTSVGPVMSVADAERLLESWGYRNAREALRGWRRRGFIRPDLVEGRPRYAFRDLVEAERLARRNRPGHAAREAARARALAVFKALRAAGQLPTPDDTLSLGEATRRAASSDAPIPAQRA
jgi:hypothetical protein